MNSNFGPFGEMLLPQDEEAADENRLRYLARDPFQAAAYTAYGSARDAGRGLATAVGNAMGYDMRSPMQKRREAAESIKATVASAGVQPGSDDYYRLLVDQFTKHGMLDSANAATQAWEVVKRQRAQTGAYERQNQPKPASAKDRLTDLYWSITEQLAADPENAGLLARKAALEKALGLKDAQPKQESADWVLVQPTQFSPGYMYNKRTGERKQIEGRIAKGGDAGEEPDSPFADLPPEARKAAERTAGKETAQWLGGDRATALRGVEALRDVQARLESDPDLVNDPVSSSLPDAMRAMTASGRAAIQARETVRQAIQATLRATLGAQFTQQEGESLMARAYDPRLSAKENIERLDRAIIELEDKISAKDSLASNKRPAQRAPREPRAGAKVRVRFPDGQTGTIPRANLPAAKARGAVEVR